jgi:hypothetical protein
MTDLCFTDRMHAVSGHSFLRSVREMCDEKEGRSNLSPVITIPPMFHFHSCVLCGRTTDSGPIRGRSCKPTRRIRRCDACVELRGSEDVPLQWGKFASGVCLRSSVTARRQLFGKRTGEVRTDWAAWTELCSECGQPMSVQPLRHKRNIRPRQQATLQTLAGKSNGNGSDNLNQDRS